MNEFKNNHYIRIDSRGRILDGWSDGPHPEREPTGAVCIDRGADYQFRLCDQENPVLLTVDDIPLYRWDGTGAARRTEEEIAADWEIVSGSNTEGLRR